MSTPIPQPTSELPRTAIGFGIVLLLLLGASMTSLSPTPLAGQDASTPTTATLEVQVVEAGSERGMAGAAGVRQVAGSAHPLAGVTVRLVGRNRSGRTDADGRLRLEGLAPGPVHLRTEAPGYHSAEGRLELVPGTNEFQLTLHRWLFELEGVVATGTPLRGAAPYQPGQAFDREALMRRAGTSFGEMLDGEPGLAMRSFGPSTGRPVIRGLDGDRVAVLENGQRMGDMSETAPDHAIAMDPLSPTRVEVVRGPASLLYGSSALGGVVNLMRDDIPRDWRPGTEAGGAIQGATVNRLEALSVLGLHGGDRWAATGRFGLRTGSDFRTPGAAGGVLPGSWGQMASGGLGVGYRSGKVEGGISVDLYDHDFGLPEALDEPDERIELRTERQRLRALVDWTPAGVIESVEFRAAAAHYFHQEIEIEGEEGGPVDEEIGHEFTRGTLDLSAIATHGTLGPASRGAIGVSLLSQTRTVTGEQEFHPDGETLALALFGLEELPLSRRFTLQVGARAERTRTRALANERFPDFSDRRSATTISASLGLNVRATEHLEVGAQLARAHRSPLLEQLFSDGRHLGAARYEIGDPSLVNEIGHGADLFAEYTTPRVRAEIAGFVNRIEDFVFPRATGDTDLESGLSVVRWSQVPAFFRGGEVSLEVAATDALTFRLTGDVVRAERRDVDRTPLPFIPPARATVSAHYDSGLFRIGGRARVAAAQNRVFLEPPTDGHALLDLSLAIRPTEGHLVSIRLDNALDTAYRDHLSRVDERRFPMPGRNLSVLYRWDLR